MKKPASRRAAGFASAGWCAFSKETTPVSTVMTDREELGLSKCAVCLMEPTLLWLRPQDGAKPNHGFFGCQHLAARNSAPRRPRWRGACHADDATRRGARDGATCVVRLALRAKCFFRGISCATRRVRVRATPARDAARLRRATPPRAARTALKKIAPQLRFSRRTKPECAELRKPARRRDDARQVREAGEHPSRCVCWRVVAHRATPPRRRVGDACRTPETKPAARWRPVVRTLRARRQWSSSSSSSA